MPRKTQTPNADLQSPNSGLAAPTDRQFAEAATLREGLQRFQRESERITREHGLTLNRYILLLMIRTGRDGSRRAPLRELTERLGLAQSTVVELVGRAESAGLVRRELSQTDRRAVYVALTDEGRARLEPAVAELARQRRRLIGILAELA